MIEGAFRFFGRSDWGLIDPGDHIALLEAGRIADAAGYLEDQRALASSEATLGLNGGGYRDQLQLLENLHLGGGDIRKVLSGRIYRQELTAAFDRDRRHAADVKVEQRCVPIVGIVNGTRPELRDDVAAPQSCAFSGRARRHVRNDRPETDHVSRIARPRRL